MDILIEEHNGGLWVAALHKGKLEGLEIDSAQEEVRWGSIYRARVTSISKSLDAAFLDLDGDNQGILYNRDVRTINKDGSITKGGAEAIGKTLRPGDVITVQAKSAYLVSEFDEFTNPETKIVQMSMDITLQGRYLIYCPFMQKNRLSARILDKKLRTQLTEMMAEMKGTKGCILRSSAAGTQTEVLRRESEILMQTWVEIEKFLQENQAGLIALGPDSIQRTLSDLAASPVERIEITTMDHYNEAEDWCRIFAPDLVTKIEPVQLDNAQEELALFHYRDIVGQIEDLFQPYVLLPGGGNIIIQSTAALTAIDINKGQDKSSNLSINMEAAKEIGRQLRLRNMGGIIVIDFLRSQNKKNEEKLLDALRASCALDPCTVQIHGKSNLGLIEVTRRRRTPPLHERFTGDIE